MHRFENQRGAALLMLIGITAALALLSSTLVFVIMNQQRATANERSGKQSFYAAEAALDTAVQFAKVDKKMSTTSEWLTPTELDAAFAGAFPSGATVTYRVYDNLSVVNYAIKWDQGGPTAPSTPDHMMWVEATVTYKGKTTRTRCLITQNQVPFAQALPKAVTYSDTGINLLDTSDMWAVDDSGNPDTSGAPYQTSITAGGTWLTTTPSADAEIGRFTMNTSADLAKPGTSTQSLGITANGSVSIGGTIFNQPRTGSISASGHTFDQVIIQAGTVGFLSDYFDQKAQSELANESQEGGTPATAPTAAPAAWSSTGYTTISTTSTPTLSTLQSTTSATTVDATTVDLVRSGNLVLSRGTAATGRTFNFRNLYVTGNLTLTGPVTVNCSSLYVGGTLTVTNTTNNSPAVTDTFGTLRVNGTGTSSVTGRVNVNSSPTYFGGPFSVTNTSTNPVAATTCNFGPVYCVSSFSANGNVSTGSSSSPQTLYAGGGISLTGYSSGITSHYYSLVYANATSSTTTLSGAVQLYSGETTLNGNFTITGPTSAGSAVKHWLGHLYVQARPFASPATGTINWTGYASVTSRDWRLPGEPPRAMWMGQYWSRSGTFNDEYGNVWIPGNSGASVLFNSTGASTMMCPLMCTTEKLIWSGDITYGTRAAPMVFFFMCDNNGIYPQVFQYQGTGTYYGLMVINESTIDVSNGSATKPSIQGAVFAGCPYDPTYTSGLSRSDIVLRGNSCIAYDQYVVGQIATSSLKTTTLITQIVPGSWQQLPVN